MNIFGIGLPEMAVIAAIGLLVFGPKRLPELGKTLGRTLKGFQSASSEFEKEFRSAIATADSSALSPAELDVSDRTGEPVSMASAVTAESAAEGAAPPVAVDHPASPSA